DRIADGQRRHPGASADDDAGALAPEGRRRARVHAERVEDVAEVEARRGDLDLDLARTRDAARGRREGEAVERALALRFELVVLADRRRGGRGADEARDVPHVAAPRDLRLERRRERRLTRSPGTG